MNRLKVHIREITVADGVVLVDLQGEDTPMSALLVDSEPSPAWLTSGREVYAIFKETEVSLAKDLTGRISLRNKLPCRVLCIDRGSLLSLVGLQFGTQHLDAAITTRSVDALELQAGDAVLAMIKANEISLMQK